MEHVYGGVIYMEPFGGEGYVYVCRMLKPV